MWNRRIQCCWLPGQSCGEWRVYRVPAHPGLVLDCSVKLHAGGDGSFAAVHNRLFPAPTRWLWRAQSTLSDHGCTYIWQPAHCSHLVMFGKGRLIGSHQVRLWRAVKGKSQFMLSSSLSQRGVKDIFLLDGSSKSVSFFMPGSLQYNIGTSHPASLPLKYFVCTFFKLLYLYTNYEWYLMPALCLHYSQFWI